VELVPVRDVDVEHVNIMGENCDIYTHYIYMRTSALSELDFAM
jgi:hypothetical protein